METPPIGDGLYVACAEDTWMTCLSFWACATPTKAATMVKAATADTISDFFIFISPCSSKLGFRFDRPGGNTYTPTHGGCGKEFLFTRFHLWFGIDMPACRHRR